MVACLLPWIVWDSHYPDDLLRYWTVGGVITVAAFLLGVRQRGATWRRLSERASTVASHVAPAGFIAVVAACATALSIFFAIYAFGKSPSTPDEIAQLWHAKLLLHRHLSLPVDPNREFFGLETVVDVGRWYSQFPIGGPLALMPGALIGAPWIVNPALIGVSTAALYWFARRAYGEVQARAVAALFAVTPMVLILAGTWMNHVPVLCLATLAMALTAEWERTTSTVRATTLATGIGLAVGLIATIRPLDAVAVAAAVGALQLTVLYANRARWRELGGQLAGGVAGVMPLLVANHATTGSAFKFGYDVAWGTGHRVGFHADPYGNAHTLGHALELATTYVSELNAFLLAWPVPAVLIVIVALMSMRKISRWDGFMLAVFAAQVVAYGAYWGDGEFLGPRFLYTALPALVVLIARAPFILAERYGPSAARGSMTAALACVVAAWLIPGIPTNVLGLTSQARDARQTLKADIDGAVKAANVHHAVVFLREPFPMRLTRRLWGIGMTKSEAAQIIARSDACSVLTAVRLAERDSAAADRSSLVRRGVVTLPSPAKRPTDGRTQIRVASRASITPECQAELDADRRLGGAPFGPALPLEQFGADGRLGGDVIYAADLGDRNDVLRARFGDRRWYRLALRPERGGLRAVVSPY